MDAEQRRLIEALEHSSTVRCGYLTDAEWQSIRAMLAERDLLADASALADKLVRTEQERDALAAALLRKWPEPATKGETNEDRS